MGRIVVFLLIFYALQICDCQRDFESADLNVPISSLSGRSLSKPLNQNNFQKSNWRLKFLEFPHLALYDSGLSNSLAVSVRVSQGPNNTNATFSFMHPSLVPCSNLTYMLVLVTMRYPTPRLEGPFQPHCQSRYHLQVYNLLTDSSYSVYVIAYNKSLSLKSSILHFTTTEVHWATVVEGANHLLVTCHFTKSSKAKGCFVDVKLLADFTLVDTHEIFSITRPLGSHVASLCVQIPHQNIAESVVIKDWKESDKTGPMSVTTFTDRRESSPCYVEEESSWKRVSHVVMFFVSSAFMVGTSALLLIAITYRAIRRSHLKKKIPRFSNMDHNNNTIDHNTIMPNYPNSP